MARNKIVFIQHGDFGEAYWRFAAGGAETYRDQKRSVDFVAGLSEAHDVCVIAFSGGETDYMLAPHLRAISKSDETATADWFAGFFKDFGPTHIIARTPKTAALIPALSTDAHVLPIFADIFARPRLRGWGSYLKLRRALRNANITLLSNHSLNASRSMIEAFGLPKSRVVPWDWSRVAVTDETKTQAIQPDHPVLFFAGGVTEDKGVGDIMSAVKLARNTGLTLSARIAGPGDLDAWRERADRDRLSDQVTFLGRIAHSDVRAEMQNADMVVVPSRHSYPEGLPNTIYEGLASRTPLIVSDHPAFKGRLEVGQHVLEFEASNPDSLLAAVRTLCTDQALYARLSQRSADGVEGLYIGMEWGDLVGRFLQDPDNTTGWVQKNALDTLGY